VDYYMTFDVYS